MGYGVTDQLGVRLQSAEMALLGGTTRSTSGRQTGIL